LVLLAALISQAAAGSVIYHWRDREGKLHFTDNAGNVPPDQWGRSSPAAVPPGASDQSDARSMRIPVEGTHKAVQIPITVNDAHPLLMYLDTGATYTQITRDDARALGLDLHTRPSVRVIMGDGRVQESRMVVLDSITIGTLQIRQVEALVGDLRLLGLNVLQHFRVTLDLPNGEVVLEAP
jgi:clan AA aspartic protease (TIGR02281 family)